MLSKTEITTIIHDLKTKHLEVNISVLAHITLTFVDSVLFIFSIICRSI